jgi:hypothetical protein
MGRGRLRARDVVIAICAVALGFALGYAIAYMQGFGACVDLGFKFLHQQGINISLDEGMVKTAIYQYQNRIGTITPLNISA